MTIANLIHKEGGGYMIGWFILTYALGVVTGVMMMALMVAAKSSDREEGDDGHRME